MGDAGEDLFRAFPDLLRLPAGGGAFVVYAHLSRVAHLLSPVRARVLFACHGLAGLDRHAARLAAEIGGNPAALRAEVAELARAGLLVPVRELVRRLREAGVTGELEEPPRITGLGVPTRGRPESLREALRTHVEDASRHGVSVAYAVADGAATEAEGAPTRAVAREVAARYGVPVSYLGPAEKARFAVALAERAGVDPALVAFALLGDARLPLATGGNRNTLLLHGAGSLVLHVDDDTRCRVVPPPDPLPGLSVTSADDPTELWPLAAPPAFADPGRAFVALHEDLLGRSVGRCVAATEGGFDLGLASAMLFRRIEARGGRVVVTQSGGAGDSGTGSMAHVLRLTGRSRARLLADEATYRAAMASRQVIRAAPVAAVGDGGACMAMGLGLDARGLLPPFSPVQRNAEGVFATVLRRCFHDALLGFVPWAAEHVPPEGRAVVDGTGEDALGGNDVLRLLVAAARVEPDREDPGRSLRALGVVLARWGSLPLRDFEERARMAVLRARSLDLSLLEDALGRHRGAPAFWARDVDRAAARVREGLSREDVGWPGDFVAALGEAQGRACFQETVRRYGELLQAWPALWEAARAVTSGP